MASGKKRSQSYLLPPAKKRRVEQNLEQITPATRSLRPGSTHRPQTDEELHHRLSSLSLHSSQARTAENDDPPDNDSPEGSRNAIGSPGHESQRGQDHTPYNDGPEDLRNAIGLPGNGHHGRQPPGNDSPVDLWNAIGVHGNQNQEEWPLGNDSSEDLKNALGAHGGEGRDIWPPGNDSPEDLWNAIGSPPRRGPSSS